MRYLAWGALALVLAACGTQPQRAQQSATTVAATEVALTAAEQAATAYVKLPQCTGANGPLCSWPDFVVRIKDYDNRAFAAVMAARANPSDGTLLSTANTAVAAFTSVVAMTVKH
jgi:hypothetical protein